MKIWQDEILLGPLHCVVKDLDEVFRLIGRAWPMEPAFSPGTGSGAQIRENIDAGMLGVIGTGPMAFFLLSGWKDSFYGDLHANGKDSIEFYTRKK